MVVVGAAVDVVVGATVVVVGGGLAPAATMTGERGGPVGAAVPAGRMPDGNVSFGYDVHVSASGEPATTKVSVVEGSFCTLTVFPLAVNGPSVAGVDGTVRATPEVGTGVGNVTLKLSVPVGIDGGVAPATSMVPEAEPLNVG